MKAIIQSCYLFNVPEKKGLKFTTYIFKDISGGLDVGDEFFNVLNKLRQEIHKPERIVIIYPSRCSDLCLAYLRKRIFDIPIESYRYRDVDFSKAATQEYLQIGRKYIFDSNKVLQLAPSGTQFIKPSGSVSDYFLKASLIFSDSQYIAFYAFNAYKWLKKNAKIDYSATKNIYIDTSTMIPFAQAFIEIVKSEEKVSSTYRIMNFKSYQRNIDGYPGEDDIFFISASTSGTLSSKLSERHRSSTFLTLFYSGEEQKKDVLHEVQIPKVNRGGNETENRKIPITAEDFSLEYAKSSAYLLKEKDVKKNVLQDSQKILNISSLAVHNETRKLYEKEGVISFTDEELIKDEAVKCFFADRIKNTVKQLIDNVVLSDVQEIKNHLEGKQLQGLEFFDPNSDICREDFEGKNVIVVLLQTGNARLVQISRKLREVNVKHVSYIIGVLWSEDVSNSKQMESNLIYNETAYKYDYYCYLTVPIISVQREIFADMKEIPLKLSDGYVFAPDDIKSSELDPILVLISFNLIFQHVRTEHLVDNIIYYDVLDPLNFRRFNDPLLRLILVIVSSGREMNYQSNMEKSNEMKDVIKEIINQDPCVVSKYFCEACTPPKKSSEDNGTYKIHLDGSDLDELRTYCNDNNLLYFQDSK